MADTESQKQDETCGWAVTGTTTPDFCDRSIALARCLCTLTSQRGIITMTRVGKKGVWMATWPCRAVCLLTHSLTHSLRTCAVVQYLYLSPHYLSGSARCSLLMPDGQNVPLSCSAITIIQRPSGRRRETCNQRAETSASCNQKTHRCEYLWII